MTAHLLPVEAVSALPGDVPEHGDPCDFCGSGALVEATVEIEVHVDGELGLHATDRAVCVGCVSAVIVDEHRGDGAPKLMLAEGASFPEDVFDPFAGPDE